MKVVRAVLFWVAVEICFGSGLLAYAQQAGTEAGASTGAATEAGLPNAPEPQQAQKPGENSPEEGKQTKRILGVVPNFRSVSANSHPKAETPKEKFIQVTQDSFDYSAFIFVGVLSGVSQLEGATPEFHTGPPAYARYYWHNFADQTDENLWVGFLLPVALRQDPRYFTLGRYSGGKHNGAVKRAGYAISRMLVTRTDAGRSSFNFSEVVGAGAASGISNLYYPASNRTWTKTGQRWALNVGVDGASALFKEFWPDLNRAVFHAK